MNRSEIEPGVLQVFRLYAGARLAVHLLSLCAQLGPDPRRISRPFPAVLETGFLLLFLSWPRIRTRLGDAFLISALVIATVAPEFEHAITVELRVQRGVRGAAAGTDAWLLIALQVVPMMLAAWQYGFRHALILTLSGAALNVLLAVPLAVRGGPPAVTAMGLSTARVILFALVAYLVARLVAAQRVQRAALASANDRLAQYAATVEQLSISRERNRLARELHDTLAHTLSAVSVQLEAVEALWDVQPEQARHTLEKAQRLTRDGLQEARRSLEALRAKPLEDLGLALAVRRLAETSAQRAGWALQLDIAGDVGRLTGPVEQTIYRVVEEALTNVVRHANARRVRVSLRRADDMVTLIVQDDGRGFDPARTSADGHYGLVGMAERASLCGGALDVTSQPDAGTTIRLAVGSET